MHDNLEAILFDLDGVLIDSEPIHEEAKRRVFAHFDLKVPSSAYDTFKGRPDQEVLEHVAETYANDTVAASELIERKRTEFRTLLGDPRPVPGAEEFVREAARRYRLGVTTSASRPTQELALRPFAWKELFETVVTADDVEHPKPDPEPYRMAAGRLGVSPERCLVIEDALSGVRSAAAAGCCVAALTTSMNASELKEAGAHHVADRFEDVAHLLELGTAAA